MIYVYTWIDLVNLKNSFHHYFSIFILKNNELNEIKLSKIKKTNVLSRYKFFKAYIIH